MRSYTAEGSQQVDFGEGTMWVTEVRDDANAAGQPVRFWDDSYLEVTNWPRYDKDNNRHVWVRAEATVRGETRAIVAWVRIEDRIVSFPQYAVLAGYLHGKNSGGHGGRPLVDSTGSLGVGRALRAPAAVGLHRPQPHEGAAAPAAREVPAELPQPRGHRRRRADRARGSGQGE